MSFTDYLEESSQDTNRYKELLKNHDWDYSQSSDNRAYKKGKASWEEIIRLGQLVDKNRKIFDKMKPKKLSNGEVVPQLPQPSRDGKSIKADAENEKKRTSREQKTRKSVDDEFLQLMKRTKE